MGARMHIGLPSDYVYSREAAGAFPSNASRPRRTPQISDWLPWFLFCGCGFCADSYWLVQPSNVQNLNPPSYVDPLGVCVRVRVLDLSQVCTQIYMRMPTFLYMCQIQAKALVNAHCPPERRTYAHIYV